MASRRSTVLVDDTRGVLPEIRPSEGDIDRRDIDYVSDPEEQRLHQREPERVQHRSVTVDRRESVRSSDSSEQSSPRQ
eukprot:EC714861.1.p1 GENE.EC714861.1~~EC714861.1.p1  ORF type:complete len:78 (+),score=3.45 EC714861.1:119-352(+)